ncbi:MAG: ParB/RepB/Spo0J family partition protein [Bacteroidaceae bacterium]|nr:ParB/RepB/Spo0J family partition protein [Bacteroidaceae bacterium]MBR4782405.1 ParB/RepB/Spo0J family partition protein [Bacteroidaceae bacterium]
MPPHKKFPSTQKKTAQKKLPALGRGLDALISTDDINPQGSSSINEIEISQIVANPNQPRREIDQESLQELADSILQIGIVQPITLRQMDDGTYQIIAGERRWRASQLAGLTTIPAYVRKASDESVALMALVENIQREDLNAIEIALAYSNMQQAMNLTQEAVAEKVGKKRTTVANYLRLLRLPAPVQLALRNKQIDQGHARAILGLESPAQQVKLFNEIQKKGYSVRKVEEMVKQINDGDTIASASKGKQAATLPQEVKAVQDKLSKTLGTKVQMKMRDGKGQIIIPFGNDKEMDKIIRLLSKIKK